MSERWGRRLSGAVMAMAVVTACASSPVPGTATMTPSASTSSTAPSTSVPSTSPPTPAPTSEPPTSPRTSAQPSATVEEPRTGSETPGLEAGTAADALVPFFAAVDEIDGRLGVAAAAINAEMNDERVTFDQQTIDTVDAAAPWPAAHAIPAGLDPATEQAVLLVYSDLASRFGSLRGGDCLQVGTVPRSSLNPECFARGHIAKVRLAGDVHAARAAAASSVFVAASPDSSAAAEVLLRVEYINKANMGCGTMGGYIATEPIPVDWSSEPSGDPTLPPTDGTVNGVRFHAGYADPAGWTIELLAC